MSHLPAMEIPRRHVLAGLTLLPGAAQPEHSPQLPRISARESDLLFEWHDAARARDVPARVRLPATSGPAPVIIVSHGLGGSRDGLAYLGQGLAEGGFVAVHLQHRGSDMAVWQGAVDVRVGMAAAILDVRNALNRLRDVVFALDLLGQVPALRGRLDLTLTAIAGHSFGAWTVTHMLGERLPGFGLVSGDWGIALPDPRLRAGIALSPVPPLGLAPGFAYDRVRAPILHVTGTEDRGLIEAATPEDRIIPFRNIPAPGVLAVLAGASHASFAGEPGAGARFNEPTYHRRTAGLAMLFLRAVMLGDAAARALLLRAPPLAPADRLESRHFAAG